MEQVHLCHAVDCNERVLPSRLMCPRHWFMVPIPLRKRVWQTYKPGQEITKTPTAEYIKAARDAINSVAKIENRRQLADSESIAKDISQLIKKHSK